jgi:16S rRNA (cytosine967-C5)-methyltransferase
LREGVTLDTALAGALAGAGNGPALAPSVRSLCYGAVRGYYRHEAILGRLLSQPVASLDYLVRALLSVALFELEDAARRIMRSSTPPWRAPRRPMRRGPAASSMPCCAAICASAPAIDTQIAGNPVTRHAAPIWLADRYRADWPVRWTQLLARAIRRRRCGCGSIAGAAPRPDYLQRLQAAGIGARAEARVPFALQLDEPCDVQVLPGFAEGDVSVQDLAAQCVAFPLALPGARRVLDACAAPGGKTALIAERRPDLERGSLPWNSIRSVSSAFATTCSAAPLAELIVGDATPRTPGHKGRIRSHPGRCPCSALGVIRRHPDIRLRKAPAEIDRLPQLQMRLLARCGRCSSPAGAWSTRPAR